jgi:DNA-binding transcriptional LysR family regulator
MVMFDKGFAADSKGFSLGTLRSLLQVCKAGYPAEAAKQFGANSDLISRQIGELEMFFGVSLRKKKGKLSILSDEGEKLAKITENFFRSLESFDEENHGAGSTLIIGAGETFLCNILLPCFSELQKSIEGERIQLSNMRSSSLPDALERSDVDLAIVSEHRLVNKEKSKVIGKVEYRLYAPMGWRTKIKKIKPLHAICKYPYAALSGSGDRKTFVESLVSKLGKKPNYELECSSHIEILEAVRSGCFCGILPTFLGEKLDKAHFASFKMSELNDMHGNLCIAWRQKIYNYKPRIEITINAIHKIFSKFLKG